MRTASSRTFDRQYKKLSRNLQEKMWQRLALLVAEESNPLLNNHKLGPPYETFRSINITGDFRLIYKKIDSATYYLRAVGTHHQLYGS